MTPPLCDSKNAEKTCEKNLVKALEIAQDNIDALQGLANLRIMWEKDAEALEMLRKVVDLTLTKEEKDMPTSDFRMQTGWLLIELQDYKKAIWILDTIVKEDDTNGEAWYNLAFCQFSIAKYQNANECIENTLNSQLSKQD